MRFNLKRDASPLATFQAFVLGEYMRGFNLKRDASPLANSIQYMASISFCGFNLKRDASPLAGRISFFTRQHVLVSISSEMPAP